MKFIPQFTSVPYLKQSGRRWLTSLMAAFLIASAMAQLQAGDLAINLVAQRVVAQADGSEVLETAGKSKPGDVIQYRAEYTNQTGGKISNLQPTLPIPAGMEYIDAGATPAPDAASLDGKTFSAIPLKRVVKQPGGGVKEEIVPAAEYRALRWSVKELGAGQATQVTARVRVSNATRISLK
ncbi:MAG: hypothetical protein AB1813_05250 [Verrucomicrobiota bacterium]